MSKAARLEPLADYAGEVETQAARRRARRHSRPSSARRAAARLSRRVSTARHAGGSGGSAALAKRTAFLAKLCEVVALREAELGSLIDSYRVETERWRDSHRRVKGLDKIVAVAAQEAAVAVAKREQLELDEHALRRVLEQG
jgi:flagellar biosynthesis chaperone FliJ